MERGKDKINWKKKERMKFFSYVSTPLNVFLPETENQPQNFTNIFSIKLYVISYFIVFWLNPNLKLPHLFHLLNIFLKGLRCIN